MISYTFYKERINLKRIEQAKKRLKDNGQLKLLSILESMKDNEKEQLAKQILKVDFELINRLYQNKDSRTEKKDK